MSHTTLSSMRGHQWFSKGIGSNVGWEVMCHHCQAGFPGLASAHRTDAGVHGRRSDRRGSVTLGSLKATVLVLWKHSPLNG